MKTGMELVADAKARITMVTVADVMRMQQSGGSFTLLDVRDQHEVNLGRIPGAIHVSRGTLETRVESLVPRDANIVVYCASDNRSSLAANTLSLMGYQHVVAMAGGFRAWAEAGGDIE